MKDSNDSCSVYLRAEDPFNHLSVALARSLSLSLSLFSLLSSLSLLLFLSGKKIERLSPKFYESGFELRKSR